MKNKKIKRSLCFVLAMFLALGPTLSFAETGNKSEVVYANLAHTGTVEEVTVVNGFEKPQQIVDFGDYETVLNLSDATTLTLEGGRVTADTQTFPFYYQGKLQSYELPWTVGIDYSLDGKTVDAEALVGQSGDFEMSISVKENTKANPAFAESYLLQITVTLANDRFQDIQAEGATVASQGEKRVINFSVLPGSEETFHLTATAENIELEPIQIAGLPFSMEFEVPDLSEQTAQFVELQDAIAQLSDGVDDYTGGVSSIYDASGELKQGAEGLSSAAYDLQRGLSSLTGGMRQYQAGLDRYVQELENGISQFSVPVDFETGGLVQLEEGARQLHQGLKAFHEGQTQALSTDGQFYQGLSAVTAGAEELSAGMQQLMNGAETQPGLIEGSAQIQGALKAIDDGLQQGMPEMSEGSMEELVGGLQQLSGALGQYESGLSGLIEQMDMASIQSLVEALQNFQGSLQNTVNRLRTPDVDLSQTTPETHPEVYALLQVMQEESYTIEAQLPILSGAIEALQGMQSFVQGAQQMQQATAQMRGGIDEAILGFQQFDSSTMLASLGQLKNGIHQLNTQYDTFHQGLSTGLTQIAGGLSSTDAQQPGVVQGLQGLQQGYRAMGDGLIDGSGRLVPGAGQIAFGVGQMRERISSMTDNLDIGDQLQELVSGSQQLRDGHRELISGAEQLESGMGQYARGIDAYIAGMGEFQRGMLSLANGGEDLSGGMRTLRNETTGMDQKIEEGIDEAMQDYMPADFEPVSFVSDKNPAPQSVQFVMMTDALRVEKDAVTEDVEPEQQSLWQRFLDLFR